MNKRAMKRALTRLAILMILVLSACSDSGEAPSAPDRTDGRVPVVRMQGGDWGYPTPFAHYPRGPGAFKMALIFDSLLERDETGLIPWLATSWTLSGDGKTYTFTLRKDVTWHDGEPLTAEDVKFSLVYMQRHPTPWALVYGMIDDVRITAPQTVAVTVREPGVPCLYGIGLSRIIPKHIWQTVETPKTYTAPEALIGTGPYRLTAYSREHGTYRFEAFDGFWGPKPRVSALEYVPVSDPVLAFEGRHIDIISAPPDLLSRYENNDAYGLIRCPPFWGYRLLMNMTRHDMFTDARLRQAIRYALDLPDMVAKIARGAAEPGMAGALPPGHVMFSPGQTRYSHDPDKARALLAELGYSPGDPRLALDLIISSRADKEVRLGEMIVQSLNNVGFSVTLVSLSNKTRDARVRDLNYDLALLGHGGWGIDADNLKHRFCKNSVASPSAYGYSGYANPTLDALFKAQHLAFDPDDRKKIIGQIQVLLADELPEIPLFYGRDTVVFRKSVYEGWMTMYDHHAPSHSKLTWLDRKGDTP